MSQQEPLNELKGFEAALASLVPRERIDRDRLMFEAGVAAARPQSAVRGRWAWPALSAVTATAAALLVVLAFRPQPEVVVQIVERVVEVPVQERPEAERKLVDLDLPLAPQRHREGSIGPLARLRWPELAQLDAGAGSRELLDRVLSTSGSHSTAAGRETSPGPVSYGEMMRDLREQPQSTRDGSGDLQYYPDLSGVRS